MHSKKHYSEAKPVGIKENPLYTTPKENKPVSNCSCLFAREGGRTRVREGEIDEADGTLRRGSSARSPRQLRASRSCRLGEPTTRRDALWCEPCLGSSLTCPSRHSPPPSPHRPCRFFAALGLRPNALASGWGGDELGSKRFGGTTERAKRRLRQTEPVLNGEARSRTGHVKIDPTRTRNGDAFRAVVDLPKSREPEGLSRDGAPGRASCLAVVKAPVLSARRLVSLCERRG